VQSVGNTIGLMRNFGRLNCPTTLIYGPLDGTNLEDLALRLGNHRNKNTDNTELMIWPN